MQYNRQGIADIGGQRVLGMRGSLTNYINKGTTKPDSFERSSGQKQNTPSKKINIGKILAGIAAAVVGIGATVFAFKKGGKIVDSVKKFFNEKSIFTKFKEKVSKKNVAPGDKSENWAKRQLEKIKNKTDKKKANIDKKNLKKKFKRIVNRAKKDAAKNVKQYKKCNK